MKQTFIYLTDSEWVLTSMSRTTAGVWIANLVIHRLASTCGDDELGAAVLQSLEASVLDAPHPDSLPGHNRKYRESLGVVNYDRFLAGCKLLAVHRVNDLVILTPNRNRGPDRGFEPLANKLTVQAVDAAALGEAARHWSEQCQ